MKGTKQIEFDGEKITYRFTSGVLEDLQEYADENDIAPEELENKIKHQRVMLSLMEIYGSDGEEWKDPDIVNKAIEKSLKYKNMDFQTMLNILESVGAQAEEASGKVKRATKKKT